MKKIKKFAALLVFMFIAGTALGQFEDIMDKAVKDYLRGDYISAISGFRRVLEFTDSEKARRLLFNSLTEEAGRRIERGQNTEALSYIKQAEEINPDSPKLKTLREKAGEPVKSKQQSSGSDEAGAALKRQVERERAAKLRYRNSLRSTQKRMEGLESDLKAARTALEAAQVNVEQLKMESGKTGKRIQIAAIAGFSLIALGGIAIALYLRKLLLSWGDNRIQLEELEEKITERLETADQESEELEARVAQSINEMVEGQKDAVKQISLSAAGKTKNDIEEIKQRIETYFEQQQERMLDLLSQQAKALSTEETEKVEIEGEGGRTVITDVNPHVRARADGVEMIPKTISDPSVAEKMLKPYLTDPNNRVRANACVAIYNYNSEAAVDTLKKMADSPDKWMRLSAAWAIGEIASPQTVSILRKLLEDLDERVKDRAMKTFENMSELKKGVSDEIRKMIDKSRKRKDQ